MACCTVVIAGILVVLGGLSVVWCLGETDLFTLPEHVTQMQLRLPPKVDCICICF